REQYSYDLTEQRVVALSRETGETVWSLAGVGECITAAVPAKLVKRLVPMCRWNSGRLTVSTKADKDNPDFTFSHLDMDLIGVDEQTGRIDWTVPLGDDPTAAFAKDSAFYSRSTQRPVDVGGTVVTLDLLTGVQSLAPKKGIYACSTYRDGFLADRPGDGSADLVRVTAGSDIYPC
ncbi:hypothetical protein, partial [Cryobacterium sp. MLB-32]|uniref:hypothetical protein n=1 Tax=Cryobacterium sp. MLB-32 TaxID=1529318 RepID=UPI0005644E48